MTDYDSIRTCCSDASICSRCWAFIAVAVKVLDQSIRNNFGYKYLLWVYSGRRGIHLWISDKEAMELTDDQRKALMGWMTVIQGGKDQHKKVNVRLSSRPLPPSLRCVRCHSSLSWPEFRRESWDELSGAFVRVILDDQDLFRSEENWRELLHLIPKNYASELEKKWEDDPGRSSERKWKDVNKIKKSLGDESPAGVRTNISIIVTTDCPSRKPS